MTSLTDIEKRKPSQWTKARGNGEGAIYQDSRGMWRAAISIDGGKRKFLSGKTRADVARKLNAALEAREKGVPMPGLRLTTAKYLTDWIEDTVKPSQKPLTTRSTSRSLTPISRRQLETCHSPSSVLSTCDKIQKEMAANALSVATINGTRTALSAALSQAEKAGLVARNVVRLVDAPRKAESDPRVFQPDEAAAFLDAAKGDDLEFMFRMMPVTGL